MEDFLRRTKSQLRDISSLTEVHVVIGNEACDLDSTVSALVYAYFLDKTSEKSGYIYLPVLDIKKKDFRLRTETVYFLKKENLSSDLLTFRDDLDLHDLHASGKLKLTLVDHNVVQSQDAFLEDVVVKVIDHRELEREEKEGVSITVALVGSCCTLVSEELLKHPSFEIDHQVALLLYGTILVDTINTSPEAGKTTPRDLAVLESLGQILSDISRDELFNELQAAKLDLSDLTTEELLEKDLKIVRGTNIEIAMSSITMDIKTFLSREDVLKDIEQFARQKKSAIVVIMTLSQNAVGSPERQLAVFSVDSVELRDKLMETLLKTDDPSLDLDLMEGFDTSRICVYQQLNVKASRKKVLPLIKSFLKDHENETASKGNNSEQKVNLLEEFDLLHMGNQSSETRTNQSELRTDDNVLIDLGASDNISQIQNTRHGNDLANFDPFSEVPQSPVQINVFNNDNDNLGDLIEADILEPPSTPDILVSGVNGYFSGYSSAKSSEPGSGYPSYPVTPPNSYMESTLANYNKEYTLPSFNSSEMVMKIQQKKHLLATYSTSSESFDTDHLTSVPYTPQNSQLDSPSDGRPQKETSLPSFNSSDMVQRIKQKRSSMGGNSVSFESGEGEPLFLLGQNSGGSGSVPFTPHNSFVDSSMPRFTSSEGFDASQLLDRLEGIQTVVPSSGKIMKITPEKLCTKPLNSVLESTSNTAVIENSGDNDCDTTRNPTSTPFAQNILTKESSELENDLNSLTGNVVAKELAKEMADDNLKKLASEYADTQNDDNDEMGDKGSGGSSGGSHGNQSGPNPPHSDNIKNSSSQNGAKNTSNSQNPLKGNNLQNIEEAMFSMAGEIIQDALESFPDERSPVIKEALNRWSLDEMANTGSNEDDIFVRQPVTANAFNLRKDLHKTSSSSSLTIETDYLPKVDPYHGNLNILGDSVEVVENVSFRKMSQEVLDLEDEMIQKPEDDEKETDEKQRVIFSNFAEHVAEDVLSSAIDTAACQKSQVLCSPESDTTETSDFSSTTTTEGSYRINDSVLSSPENIPEFSLEDMKDEDDKDSETEKRENVLPQEQTLESVKNQDTQMMSHISISNESLSSCTGARSDISGLENSNKSLSRNDGSVDLNSEQSLDGIERKESWDKSHDIYSFNSVNTTTISSENNIDCSQKGDNSKANNLLEVKKKEVYQTTAGRISLPSDSAVDMESPHTPGSEVKFSSGSPDPILEESKTQVGKMIARADNLIAQVDATLAFLNGDDPCMDVFTQNTDENQKPPANMARRKHPSSSSTDGKEKFKEIEFTEEWQDDDIPGMPQDEEDSTDSSDDDDDASTCSDDSTKNKPKRPTSFGETHLKRKITADLGILNDVGQNETDDIDDDDIEVDEPPTPDDPDTSELEWENDTPITTPSQPIPEFTAEEEYKEAKHWRGVEVGGKQRKIDLRVIEPYKKVLSHGGYYGDGLNAIIIFSGCFLPDRGRKDYQYVMDNLFLYVLSTLELLVAEDYMIVYFHGATPRRQMPSFGWLKRCYQMIDRRLKKNLKGLLLVHPTLWLKTVVIMTRPFISAKFSSKLKFVKSLNDLGKIVPMEYIFVPDQVQHIEALLAKNPNLLDQEEEEEADTKGEKKEKKEKKKIKWSFRRSKTKDKQ